MPPMLIIYNPVAGRGRSARMWPEVARQLRAAGVAFEVAQTTRPLEAISIAEQAALRYTTIVAIGGDGTLNEVATGLLRGSGEQETIPVGIVPLGNGDDFAKVVPPEAAIGSQPFDWHAAVAKLTRPALQTRLFDVGRIQCDRPRADLLSGPVYFLNAMDVGFGAQVAFNSRRVPKYLSGFGMYMAAIMRTMYEYFIPRLRVQVDDQPAVEQASTMTAVTNGRCLGNSFWLAPDARTDDGLLDVMMADPVGRLTILGLIPKLMKGTHTHEPVIKMMQGRRIVIDSPDPLVVEADGEIPFWDAHHLEIEVLPQKLRIVI